jgi:hypothetical protein
LIKKAGHCPAKTRFPQTNFKMLPTEEFTFKSRVEMFPGKGGWTYVRTPEIYSEMVKGYIGRVFVPIIVTVGKTTWRTSLLPFKKGSHFIALKKEIRKLEDINFGDEIEVSFHFKED